MTKRFFRIEFYDCEQVKLNKKLPKGVSAYAEEVHQDAIGGLTTSQIYACKVGNEMRACRDGDWVIYDNDDTIKEVLGGARFRCEYWPAKKIDHAFMKKIINAAVAPQPDFSKLF